MSQSVVTNYFTKKRRGGYIQPSKRLKLSSDDVATCKERGEKTVQSEKLVIQPDKIVEEIRNARTQAIAKKQQKPQPRRSKRNAKVPVTESVPSLDAYFSQNSEPAGSLEDLTLRLSPSSSKSSLCGSEKDYTEIITAADDDHDEPTTPSKRQKKTDDSANIQRQKRGRVTPKKRLAYEFSAAENPKSDELKPDTEFAGIRRRRRNPKKKLSLSDEESSGKDDAKKTENVAPDEPQNPSSVKKKTGTLKDKNRTDGNFPKQADILNTAPKSKATEKDALITQNTEQMESDKSAPRTRRTRSRINGVADTPGPKEKSTAMKKSKNIAEKLLAKKMDSPDTVKEKLKGSSKLKDLQETLMKMKEQKKKQQEKEKSKKITKKQEEKEKQASKEQKVVEKRQFAYETLHSLAQDVPKGLPLPFKYKILAEMFRCTDTVVGMLFNRQQVTTWTNLQKSVKEMIRKNFELDHLGQIKTVFPSAYQYRQEKGIMSYADHIRPSDYQLTLEPILDERECDQFGAESQKLTSSMLVKRRHHFFVQLVEVVKEHHRRFLSTLEPPVAIPDEKLLRWHPQFPLDRVPDLEVSDLPKAPNHDKDKCSSAKDVIDKARSKFTKKARDALKKVAESMTPEKSPRSPVIEENNNISPTTPIPPAKPAAALKGVSQSLLAKIRAKEAEKKMKEMVRSDEDCSKLQILIKLPDVARALRMLFVTEKKAALQMEYICNKLVRCATGILSPGVVQDHVTLLLDCVPSWVTKATVRNATYIKMNKNKEMSEIVAEIQVRIKEAEKA